jgi:hypothetical protein
MSSLIAINTKQKFSKSKFKNLSKQDMFKNYLQFYWSNGMKQFIKSILATHLWESSISCNSLSTKFLLRCTTFTKVVKTKS